MKVLGMEMEMIGEEDFRLEWEQSEVVLGLASLHDTGAGTRSGRCIRRAEDAKDIIDRVDDCHRWSCQGCRVL